MIQLYSLMWILAVFGTLIGFLRGWNREVIATAGVLLGTFALFQLDSLLRGTLLLGFPRTQAFIVQLLLFFVIVFFAYQNRIVDPDEREKERLQTGILGGVVGFFNGYLVGGAIWYFMDINEYPLSPLIMAPGPDSPSAENISMIPVIILSGGTSGGGELLLIGVIVLFVLVLVVL